MGKSKSEKGKRLYVLFESASGYGVFEVVEMDEMDALSENVQKSVSDPKRFGEICKLKGFQPFTSPENALENMMAVSEGQVTEELQNFLEVTLPKAKSVKKASYQLGVTAPVMGSFIQENLNIPCVSNEVVREIVRGCRQHLSTYIKTLRGGRSERAQLGLAHSYSRYVFFFLFFIESPMRITMTIDSDIF